MNNGDNQSDPEIGEYELQREHWANNLIYWADNYIYELSCGRGANHEVVDTIPIDHVTQIATQGKDLAILQENDQGQGLYIVTQTDRQKMALRVSECLFPRELATRPYITTIFDGGLQDKYISDDTAQLWLLGNLDLTRVIYPEGHNIHEIRDVIFHDEDGIVVVVNSAQSYVLMPRVLGLDDNVPMLFPGPIRFPHDRVQQLRGIDGSPFILDSDGVVSVWRHGTWLALTGSCRQRILDTKEVRVIKRPLIKTLTLSNWWEDDTIKGLTVEGDLIILDRDGNQTVLCPQVKFTQISAVARDYYDYLLVDEEGGLWQVNSAGLALVNKYSKVVIGRPLPSQPKIKLAVNA
jgi:hypothetical protein